MRRAAAAALVVVLAGGLAACESTQDRSRRLAKANKGILNDKGLSLAGTNRDVKIVATKVLQDKFGTAAVVELENTTRKGMLNVPVSIDVRAAKGAKSLFKNDSAGLDPALASAPLLPAGRRVVWINNQVVANGSPSKVLVKVGAPKAAAPARSALPKIALTKIRTRKDADGTFAFGTIENRSKVLQRRLTIFCVARKGGKVVAAGRAVIDKLSPGKQKKPTTFRVYFIGKPAGAKLGFYAPPVQLK